MVGILACAGILGIPWSSSCSQDSAPSTWIPHVQDEIWTLQTHSSSQFSLGVETPSSTPGSSWLLQGFSATCHPAENPAFLTLMAGDLYCRLPIPQAPGAAEGIYGSQEGPGNFEAASSQLQKPKCFGSCEMKKEWEQNGVSLLLGILKIVTLVLDQTEAFYEMSAFSVEPKFHVLTLRQCLLQRVLHPALYPLGICTFWLRQSKKVTSNIIPLHNLLVSSEIRRFCQKAEQRLWLGRNRGGLL